MVNLGATFILASILFEGKGERLPGLFSIYGTSNNSLFSGNDHQFNTNLWTLVHNQEEHMLVEGYELGARIDLNSVQQGLAFSIYVVIVKQLAGSYSALTTSSFLARMHHASLILPSAPLARCAKAREIFCLQLCVMDLGQRMQPACLALLPAQKVTLPRVSVAAGCRLFVCPAVRLVWQDTGRF